jgi:L-amino acid N-acyltransferase YncA
MTVVRAIREKEREHAAELLTERWGSPIVVSRGVRHDMRTLPTLVAEDSGEIGGLLTYAPSGDTAEIVSLDALLPGHGVGSALMDAMADLAIDNDWWRLWLVTTNDNTRAVRFFQRRGFDLVAVHRGAVDEARRLKPEIPATGEDGIPIRHELELELLLQ